MFFKEPRKFSSFCVMTAAKNHVEDAHFYLKYKNY